MVTWVGRRHPTAGPAPAVRLLPTEWGGGEKVPTTAVAAELISHGHIAAPQLA